VHRKRSQVAVVTEDGTVQVSKNTVNGSAPFLRLIGDLPAGTPVASGAAFGWGWLAGLLEDYGFEAHLVHPLRCKAIASARLKNDKGRRRDASPAAARRPAPAGARRPVRQLRALLRHRAGLVRLGTRQRNRIHAVVADFGYDRSGSYLSGPGRGWLAGLDLPPVSREVVAGCLAVTGGLAPVTGRIGGELHARARAGPRVGTLTTLPGAGQFTALVMLAEIGGISRFGSARKPASRAGLTPAVRGPGPDRPARAHPGQGPAWLRWVLNQAAQTARRSPDFAAAYAAIARRRGKKIATIAISRKLPARAWHLLDDMQATSTNEPPRRP
jgi:transposase